MKCKIIDCQPMDRGFGAHRGIDDVPGYDFQVLCDSEEYWLNVSASKTFLGAKRITKKEDYKKICWQVIKQGMNHGHFNKVKKKWENNDKNCFALVTYLQHTTEQARITYGATWDMKPQDIWLTGVIGVK